MSPAEVFWTDSSSQSLAKPDCKLLLSRGSLCKNSTGNVAETSPLCPHEDHTSAKTPRDLTWIFVKGKVKTLVKSVRRMMDQP